MFDKKKAHPSGTLWRTRGVRTAVPEGYAYGEMNAEAIGQFLAGKSCAIC